MHEVRTGGEKPWTGYLPHQLLGPGLVIWKSARAEATRVVRTAKDASRELNIFQRYIFKNKTEKPLREEDAAARERTGRQQGTTGGARESMKKKVEDKLI